MAGLLRPLMRPVRYDLEEDEKRAPTIISEATPGGPTFAGGPGAVGATPQPVDYSKGGAGLLGGSVSGTVPVQQQGLLGGGGLSAAQNALSVANTARNLPGLLSSAGNIGAALGAGTLGAAAKLGPGALGRALGIASEFGAFGPGAEMFGSLGVPKAAAPATASGVGGLLGGLAGIGAVVGIGGALRGRGKKRRARRERQRAEKIGRILQGDQEAYESLMTNVPGRDGYVRDREGNIRYIQGEPGDAPTPKTSGTSPYMLAWVANKYYGDAASGFVSDMAQRMGLPAGTSFQEFARIRDQQIREQQRITEEMNRGP